MTTKPVPIPNHKLGQAMQHMVEQGKRPCFRIDGIRITMASAASVNPGYLYIKDDSWNYLGKISPDGILSVKSKKAITQGQASIILDVIHDPETTAMSNGKATGTCCCCGRTLTNKLSIELGIGPICRGFWFPPANVDTVAMLETLDAVEELGATPEEAGADKLLGELSSLELDLGIPAAQPKVTLDPANKEPVIALFNEWLFLNSTQQSILAHMIQTAEIAKLRKIEEVETNDRN